MNIPSLAIKVFLTLLILTLAVVAAAGIIMTRPMPEPVAIAPNVVAIRGIQMEAENIPLTIYAQGVVEPLTASELITQVNGRIAWVSPNFNAGGFFKQGEPLVKLESEDYEARVGLAEAREVRALAEFEHATFELKRMRALVKDQLVSQAMLENAVRQTRLTEAALKEAQINLDQAERDLDRTELRAPFDAIVRSKAVDLGEFVSMGKPLAQLFAADGFEVRLPVLDTQLAYLNLPSSIEATAPLNSTNLRVCAYPLSMQEPLLLGTLNSCDLNQKSIDVQEWLPWLRGCRAREVRCQLIPFLSVPLSMRRSRALRLKTRSNCRGAHCGRTIKCWW